MRNNSQHQTLHSWGICLWDDNLLEYRLQQSKIEKKVLINMSDDYIYDDINLTKRKTITNGVKYDFYIYKMLSLEKKLLFLKYQSIKTTAKGPNRLIKRN